MSNVLIIFPTLKKDLKVLILAFAALRIAPQAPLLGRSQQKREIASQEVKQRPEERMTAEIQSDSMSIQNWRENRS